MSESAGAQLVPDAPQDGGDRDAKGRFKKGNRASLAHGLFSQAARGFAALHHEAQAFLDAALGDEGDPNDLTARRRALLGYRARLHRRIVQLDTAISERGVLDGSGKLRGSWLQRLESLISTATRLDALLGLTRQTKDINTIPLDAWLRFEEAQEQARAAAQAGAQEEAPQPAWASAQDASGEENAPAPEHQITPRAAPLAGAPDGPQAARPGEEANQQETTP